MSIGNPGQPRNRRAAGGGRFVFLLVLAFAAFFLFRNSNDSQPNPESNRTQETQPSENGRFDPFDSTQTNLPNEERHPDSNDWALDEVPAKKQTSEQNSTSSGDWELEEVPAKSKDNEVDLNLSGRTKPDAPKSTEQNDWNLEEVPAKKDKRN